MTVFRTFGDDPATEIYNMKTKYKFQGEIGQKARFDYDLPTGRYYEKGQTPPRFDMTIPMVEQSITAMKPNENFFNDEELENEDAPF